MQQLSVKSCYDCCCRSEENVHFILSLKYFLTRGAINKIEQEAITVAIPHERNQTNKNLSVKPTLMETKVSVTKNVVMQPITMANTTSNFENFIQLKLS